MTESVSSLLALARSPSWEIRSQAARALAPHIDARSARQAVLDLLRDPDNTGVSEAALEALLDRQDQLGTELVFEAVATADEECAEHLLYFLARDHGRDVTRATLRRVAGELSDADRGLLSDGAAAVLEVLEASEMSEDVAAYREAKAADDEERVGVEEVRRDLTS